MPDCKLVDFEIMVQGEQAPFALQARYRDMRQTGRLNASVRDDAWSSALRDMEATTMTADADAITGLGARLFAELFHNGVRDLWAKARGDVEDGRIDGLRLRLDIEPADVAALPWEALYDPRRDTVFAADSQFTLVRAATNYSRVARPRRLRVDFPIGVLIVAPKDADGLLDIPAEIERTRQILSTLGPDRVHISVMDGVFGITDVRHRLAETRPAVLHFIGHGAPDGLWLWHLGQPFLVGPSSWRSVLSRARTVKLVVLNACLAARNHGPDAFNSVGMKLLQAGVPAVVAMQTSIADEAALSFAHSLYDELICGECPGLIDLAVSAARSELYTNNPGDFSFGAPVLWLNSPDGRVFDLNDGKRSTANPATPTEAIDLDAEAAWLAQVEQSVVVERLPAAYQFVAARWQSLLDELHSLLAQLRGLAAQDNEEAFNAKVIDFQRNKAAALRLKQLIEDAQE